MGYFHFKIGKLITEVTVYFHAKGFGGEIVEKPDILREEYLKLRQLKQNQNKGNSANFVENIYIQPILCK